MKTFLGVLAIAFLLVVNWPAQAFQTHPKPHKVKKHKAPKHHLV
jgi:hypothetical protein